MAKIKKMMKKRNIRTGVISLFLAVAVLASAFIYFGDEDVDNVEAVGPSKEYMSYIMDRIITGMQDSFNILEIVPYTGQGEFRYFAGAEEVEKGLEANQSVLKKWYNTMNNPLVTFGYDLSFIDYGEGEYRVKSNELFLSIMPEYASHLSGRVQVDTVEANDLTEDVIKNADLIVISMGSHNDDTIAMYNAFAGNTEGAFVDVNGNATSATTYDTYEKVVAEDGSVSIVSRDASWDMCEMILEYTKNTGRELRLTNDVVTLKTPVILDGRYSQLTNTEGNIYKLAAEYSATTDNYLTDDLWVYPGTELLLTAHGKQEQSVTAYSLSYRTNGSNMSNKDIMQYLIGVQPDQATLTFGGGKLRVLEIQPYNSFNYDTLDKVKALGEKMGIAGASGWTESNYKNYIDVTCVTTNAVNGMANDFIADYDMIVIGDNASLRTSDSNGTIYNDVNLNGYIYLAFGDLYKMGTSLLGYLPTEYLKVNDTIALRDGVKILDSMAATGTGRSGNQVYYSNHYRINDNTRDAWNDFIWDSLPHDNGIYVLKNMHSYYFTRESSGNIGYLGIDKNNLAKGDFYTKYSMGNTRLPDNDITDITKQKLLDYAAAGKLLVLADCVFDLDPLKVYPTSDMYDFAQKIANAEKTENSYCNIIRESNIGSAYSHLNSIIPTIEVKEAPASADDPNNYVDGFINAFCDRNNINFKIGIKGQPGKQYNVQLYVDKNADGIIDVYKAGESVSLDDSNERYVNTYTDPMPASGEMEVSFSTKLADDFVGLMSWKIVVTQLEQQETAMVATPFTNEVVGYSAVKNEEQKDVRVLQILPIDHYYTWGITLNLKTATYFNEEQLNKIASAVGYNITIDTKTTYEFEQEYYDSPYTKGESKGKDEDYLKAYDMVVLGFADGYARDDIVNTYGAVDNILDFVESGKALMLTHDTVKFTSTMNYESSKWDDNGLTKMLSINGGTGRITQDGGWTNGEDGFESTVTLTQKLRNLVGMDKYGVTLSEDDRDGKEKPQYDATQARNFAYGTVHGEDGYYHKDTTGNYYVGELQGYNPWILYRACFISGSKVNNYNNPLTVMAPYTRTDYLNNNNDSKLWRTTKTVQLNKGQITMYPYSIGETLTVAQTHGQYYELDMEDEDLVVWYTLSSDGSAATDFYGTTEKDAGNNYYIYTKGNITYTGAGHATIDGEMEQKLFINTIIKAIAGGNNRPVVAIVNGSKGNDGYYVYMDSSFAAENYTLDIKASDSDLISLEQIGGGDTSSVGRFKKGEVYWESPTGESKLIMTYEGANALQNGLKRTLRLGDANLTDAELATIEDLVEGTGDTPGTGARFKVYVEDSKGASTTIYATIVEKNMFNLD